jgi:toxin FitB
VIGWLLDTNILSELRRPRPEAKLVAFVAAQPLASLFVSVATLAELRFGIERLPDADRRAELHGWLTLRVRPMFGERVLTIDEEVMLQWRLLVEEGRKVGYTYSQPDLLIAATARNRGLTVVSRDTSDYLRSGTPVHNPWA